MNHSAQRGCNLLRVVRTTSPSSYTSILCLSFIEQRNTASHRSQCFQNGAAATEPSSPVSSKRIGYTRLRTEIPRLTYEPRVHSPQCSSDSSVLSPQSSCPSQSQLSVRHRPFLHRNCVSGHIFFCEHDNSSESSGQSPSPSQTHSLSTQ